MKLFQICMIATLLAISFTNTYSTKILANNRLHHKSHTKNLIQLLNGVVSTLGGGDRRLQKCIPQNLREVPGQEENTSQLSSSGGPL